MIHQSFLLDLTDVKYAHDTAMNISKRLLLLSEFMAGEWVISSLESPTPAPAHCEHQGPELTPLCVPLSHPWQPWQQLALTKLLVSFMKKLTL